ncbi:MAG: oligoribonuclease [Acidimicrobiales bacterium]|nr:oligoribonuclease [Acidimicrobiales bacterium]
MDLEMTGLDPGKDTIVEIATLITDDDLNIVAEGPDLVIATSPQYLDSMDDYVKSMHTKSGLLKQIEASEITLKEATATTLSFLKEHLEEGTTPLAGNSIATDRKFLAAHAVELEDFFHYRSVDVSAIKELCKRWYPKAFESVPKKFNVHRALDDIKESIVELKYYKKTIFKDISEIN